MNFPEHFLPPDISKASEEYWRTVELLTITLNNLQEGDMETAKHCSIGLLKSIHELSKLNTKKRNADRQDFANMMNRSGVHIELVRRRLFDPENS